MKDAHPSILDVILTNRPSLLFNITHFTCGISDWHNMISYVIKGAAPPPNNRKIKCRSYSHFDEKVFSEAVGVIPFDVAYVFDDVDDIYWAHEILITDVLNEHAPIKEKTVKTMQTPFMNSKLRKAVFKSQCFSTNTKLGVLRPTAKKSLYKTKTAVNKTLLFREVCRWTQILRLLAHHKTIFVKQRAPKRPRNTLRKR